MLKEILRRLLPKKKNKTISDDRTVPLSADQLKTVTREENKYYPIQLLVGTSQSIGRQRDHNEDSMFYFTAVLTDTDREQPFALFIVADGMGGHENGELASSIACRTMAEFVIKKLYDPVFGIIPSAPSESIQEVMETGVQMAQQGVLSSSNGGGTTLSAALLVGSQITTAHVGDSRVYFIHPDGRMQTVTQDHSLVRKLVELGQISESEAAVHPQRNVLYKALGQSESIQPEIKTFPVPLNGYMLLCSDGLWGVVPDNEIFKIISRGTSVSESAHQLISAANHAGGPDNISVLLIHFCH